MKLEILTGLPASKKSTYALANRDDKTVIVSRDNIRHAQYGKWWSADMNEGWITKLEKQQIISAFENGFNVISDGTNLHKSNVQKLYDLAAQFQAEVVHTYFEVPPETCIEYDAHREKKVGAKVINRMAKRAGIDKNGVIPRHTYYYHEIKPYVVTTDTYYSRAIVVDIDGTIALKSDRSPYDYSRVFEDDVSENVATIVKWLHYYQETGHPDAPEIIFLSGRSEDCREETERWLEDKFWNYDEINSKLFMRPSDDPNTADFIVKDRLFDKYVADHFNVIGVFDDRRQVVQMWRTKGLTVLDVAGNKF